MREKSARTEIDDVPCCQDHPDGICDSSLPFSFLLSKRNVAAANLSLHEAHCLRFLKVCPDCNEPVALKDMKEHFEKAHEQVRCQLYHQSMQQYLLECHESEECQERTAKCPFCELDLPYYKLQEHRNACGSRTTRCWDCSEYVMYKVLEDHKLTCQAREGLKGPGPQTNLCQQCNCWIPEDQYLQHLPGFPSSPWQLPSSPATSSPAAERDVRPKKKDLSSAERPSLKPPRSKSTSGWPAFTASLVPQALEDDLYDQLVTCSQCNILLPSPTLQKHEKKCQRAASIQPPLRRPRLLRKGGRCSKGVKGPRQSANSGANVFALPCRGIPVKPSWRAKRDIKVPMAPNQPFYSSHQGQIQ
ncbi:XIAP-associated factor 1 isoform X2 [Hemicordylus capensis]|uniref:XIAP-associated factor 1 isoform X2 n=1 Tax=Hemicordylus capensis TaxID=884348 RepID=UPI0023036CFC|nr:XIAP-associated factor 1 isoform X2 [Hemicordylus capensis]